MDASVTGLQPGTTYHFQVVATNSFGDRVSQDVTFTTLLNPRSYQAWELVHSLLGGKTDDDDKDGVSNLLEYAFGLDPRDRSDGVMLPQPELLGSRWRLHYEQPSNVLGVSYSAEWSENLMNWYPCTNNRIGSVYDFWTPTSVGKDGRLFTRWKILHSDD